MARRRFHRNNGARPSLPPAHVDPEDYDALVSQTARMTDDDDDSDSPLAPLQGAENRDDLFRLLVENVRDYAIFMLDPGGHVASWNAGAQNIKGYKAEEILGRHVSVFYEPDAVARRWPNYELEQARLTGRCEDEGWRVRKDGTRFWANVVISAVRDHRNRFRGFAKVTRDLTSRREMDALRRSEARMNEFLAMLAHELRNPLAPIQNALD